MTHIYHDLTRHSTLTRQGDPPSGINSAKKNIWVSSMKSSSEKGDLSLCFKWNNSALPRETQSGFSGVLALSKFSIERGEIFPCSGNYPCWAMLGNHTMMKNSDINMYFSRTVPHFGSFVLKIQNLVNVYCIHPIWSKLLWGGSQTPITRVIDLEFPGFETTPDLRTNHGISGIYELPSTYPLID